MFDQAEQSFPRETPGTKEKTYVELVREICDLDASSRANAVVASLDLAKLCAELQDKKEGGAKQKADAIGKLPWRKARFSKYCVIGRCAIIYECRDIIPQEWSKQYLLAKAEKEDPVKFAEVLKSGNIHPNLKRQDIERMFPSKAGNRRPIDYRRFRLPAARATEAGYAEWLERGQRLYGVEPL